MGLTMKSLLILCSFDRLHIHGLWFYIVAAVFYVIGCIFQY